MLLEAQLMHREDLNEVLSPGAFWQGNMPVVIINGNYQSWEQQGVCVCVRGVRLRKDNWDIMIIAEKTKMEVVGGQLKGDECDCFLARGSRQAGLGSAGVFHQKSQCDFTARQLINIVTWTLSGAGAGARVVVHWWWRKRRSCKKNYFLTTTFWC